MLYTIGTNAVANDFTAEGEKEPVKPQKRITEAYRGVTTQSENTGTVNYAYNIKMLEQTTAKIIKGLEGGQEAKELLLIAIQGLDLARGTTELYEHATGIYSTVYTDVLQDKTTAQIDRQKAVQRLERLQKAEPQTAEDKARITRAIAEHQRAIERYDRIINGT